MRTAVIMQPTYLPWLGYFDLIDQSDVCVLLDDAQFSKQSWHQRNRIRTSDGLQYLTVPTRRHGELRTSLRDVRIAVDSGFPRSHIRSIEQNYRRAPFFEQYFSGICTMLNQSEPRLSVLNVNVIKWLAEQFGIRSHFLLSSELDVDGVRVGLMIGICKAVTADTYLSPMGATYLATEFEQKDAPSLKVFFHVYQHPEYRQVYRPFLPFASAIDLLFNEGDRSLDFIRAGRAPPLAYTGFCEESKPYTESSPR